MRGLGPSTEDELPKSIIVTNVDTSVFENPQLKVSDNVRLARLYFRGDFKKKALVNPISTPPRSTFFAGGDPMHPLF